MSAGYRQPAFDESGEIKRLREVLELIASPPVNGNQPVIETMAFCIRTARSEAQSWR